MYYKITNASVTINANTILEEINLEIKDKDHIAIVGRNGAGKTTLLNALINNADFEQGLSEEKFTITKSGIKNIGVLKQESLNSNHTLEEEILSVYREIINLETKIKKLEKTLEKGATTKEIEEYTIAQDTYKIFGGFSYQKEYLTALKKFGFKEPDFKRPISSFSGGEKTKIAFLKLLLSKPDLLLLDEPTNHLDIKAILWLEAYLQNYPKTFVIVSHDRMFINNVTNKIYEIEYGKTTLYSGNYEYYEQEKKRRFLKTLKDYEYQQKEIKRLQNIADRFRYKPSKASMAMSKLKMIERMTIINKPESANTKTFNIKNMPFKPSGLEVLKINNLSIGYDKPLSIVNLEITKGARIGVIGANGLGKSTLLKTIISKIPSLGGTFTFGSKVNYCYFDQNLDTLNPKNTIYEEFSHTFKELNNFELRSLLATFMFYESDLEKKISVLSGGEKVRLELCKILYQNPNFLILDEPTNHLDILSKNELESILKNYQGTILFVSHDRYFIKEIATSLLVFTDDSCTYYNFNYNEYQEKIKEEKIDLEKPSKVDNKSPKINKNLTKDIAKIEKAINKKEKELKDLKDSLYEPNNYNNYELINKLNKEIEIIEIEISNLMNTWEELNNNS